MVTFDFTGDRALHPGITFGPYTFLFNSTVSRTVGVPTLNIPANQFSITNHGLINGDQVRFETTNTMPTGLETAFFYYVINAATDTFKVSLTSGGSAVVFTDTGTGTLTVIERGIPLDLTGWTPWAWVKKKTTDTDAAILLDLAPTIVAATDGRVQITKTDEDTFALEEVKGFWDLIMEDVTGQRLGPFAHGKFDIVKIVTHPAET